MIFKSQTREYLSTLETSKLEEILNHVKRWDIFYSLKYILNLKRELRLRKIKSLKK